MNYKVPVTSVEHARTNPMATEPHQYVLRDGKTGEVLREATDEEVFEAFRNRLFNGSYTVEVDGRLCYVEG